jgi:hypothetical protein
MKHIIQKQCDICQQLFEVVPQVAKRQNTCNKLECKLEHKRRYNEQWRAKQENADYFKGRYPDLKEWLKRHPGYLKHYRAQRNRISKQKSNDIQVELTPIDNNRLTRNTIKILNDIQVELNANINNKKQRLQQLVF